MSPISLIFLGLCAFLLGFWLVRQRERQRFKSSSFQSAIAPTKSVVTRRAAQPTQSTSSDALKDDVQQLIFQGRKIEAIKRVREQTGWGLKQAKDYVEKGLEPGQTLPATKRLDPEIMAVAQQLWTSHQKIAAIKLIRTHTGWGLKATKDYLDNL